MPPKLSRDYCFLTENLYQGTHVTRQEHMIGLDGVCLQSPVGGKNERTIETSERSSGENGEQLFANGVLALADDTPSLRSVGCFAR